MTATESTGKWAGDASLDAFKGKGSLTLTSQVTLGQCLPGLYDTGKAFNHPGLLVIVPKHAIKGDYAQLTQS